MIKQYRLKQLPRWLINLLIAGLILVGTTAWQYNVVKADAIIYTAPGVNTVITPGVIPAGGEAKLTISISNSNSFALLLASDPDALQITLPANLYFTNPSDVSTNCAGTVTTIGTTLTLIGGSIPLAAIGTPTGCYVEVNVTSTVPTGVNAYRIDFPAGGLNTLNPTGIGDATITNATPSVATLIVTEVQAPSLTKSFAPNTVWIGQNSVLTVNVKNNDTENALSGLTLTDTLPTNLVIGTPALPSGWNSYCGGLAAVTGPTGLTPAPGDGSFTIKKATANATTNATCSIKVNVTSLTPGAYSNIISARAIQSDQGVTNASAAAASLNVQSVKIEKVFSPDRFQSGSKTKLTITLQNPSTSPYTGVSFTDNLPAGLFIATPASTATTCKDDTHIPGITSGTSSVSLSGGYIKSGSISSPGYCTVEVMVTSNTPANYTNTIPIGSLTSDQHASNVVAATANLEVFGLGLGVIGTKSFATDPIPVNGVSQLSINITAPPDIDLSNFGVTDALPSGLSVAVSPGASKSTYCGSGTFAPAAGDTFLIYSGGAIPAGRTCTLKVNVTSSTPGYYVNVISPANISNTEGRTMSGNISDSLTVGGLSVKKYFYPPAVAPGGLSTLTIELYNDNPNQIDNVVLSDTLPTTSDLPQVVSKVEVADPQVISTTCGSIDIVSIGTDNQTISINGGTIPAAVGGVQGLCTINVDVVGLGAENTTVPHTNTIPIDAVSGKIHNTETIVKNPAAASATLKVLPLTIVVGKVFSDMGQVFGGSAATLTITLNNPNAVPLTGIHFTDVFPGFETGKGIIVANPPNLSVGSCGGKLTASPGGFTVDFKGGTLLAHAECYLTLSVTMNVTNNQTNLIKVGDVKTTNGAVNIASVDASLVNLATASVNKVFSPNPILAGGADPSVLTITIQNMSNVPLTAMGLIDTLPAGVSIVSEVDPVNHCGGNVTTILDDVTQQYQVALADGLLDSLASCTIAVSVTASKADPYINCIPENSLQARVELAEGGYGDVTLGKRACDTLVVEQPVKPPKIAKVFTPDIIPVNTTSALKFTITNDPDNTVALTGVNFIDTLPAGVTLSSVPNGSQCSGIVTRGTDSVTGGDQIILSGGTIPSGGACTVLASVTSSAAGVYDNVSEKVGAENVTSGLTGLTAEDILTVVAPPLISKAFSPNPMALVDGSISTLTFTITNPVDNTKDLTNVAFTDVFPAGMTVANPPVASQCGGTVSATTNSVTLKNGTVEKNNICTVSVDVTAGGGSFHNTSSTVTSSNGGEGNQAESTLVVKGAGLSLQKTTTAKGFLPGGTAPYHYVLTNTGTLTLYPPYEVSDDHIGTPAGTVFSCNDASVDHLDTGDSASCSVNYSIQTADLLLGSLTNTATGYAKDGVGGGNTITSNMASVTLYLEQLTLKKRASVATYLIAGNHIDYTYNLTNTGRVTLYGTGTSLGQTKDYFMVADDHIGSPLGTPFTCDTTTTELAPGATLACSDYKRYTITSDDLIGNRYVENTATAVAKDNNGVSVTSNKEKVRVYMMTGPTMVKAFSPSIISVGTTSTLTFTITNPAPNPVPLTGVNFTDTFPEGLTVADPPSESQCGGGKITHTDNSITLAGGTVINDNTCIVSVIVTATDMGSYVNTSEDVSSTNGGKASSNTTASATLYVVAPPEITKAFSPTRVWVNDTENPHPSTITFTITNPNTTQTLNGVEFSDAFPSGLKVAAAPVASISAGCGPASFAPAEDETSLTFSDGVLLGGATCTVTVDVVATIGGDKINTTGIITSTEGGEGGTSNTATLAVDDPKLLLVKAFASGKSTYDTLGATITYNYKLTNSGSVTLVGKGAGGVFTITDNKINGGTAFNCPATPTGLAPGESVTCTADYTVTQADLDNGSITNTAQGHGRYGIVDINSNTDTLPATAVQNADLTVVKSSNISSYSTVGTVLKYEFLLTNSGNVTITGTGSGNKFVVTDVNSTINALVTCPDSPILLGSGASIKCATSNYLITQADLDAGKIDNTATGYAVRGSTSLQDTSSKTVTAVQTKSLSLAKTITSTGPYSAVGDKISYDYTLTNNGNVTLVGNGTNGNFTITDNKVGTFDCGTATSLAPLASVTCTANYSIILADLNNCSGVTNLANGYGKFGATLVTSNQATKTATTVQTKTLTFSKTITAGDPYTLAGHTVTYTYLLTNNGNVTLGGNAGNSRFTVTDNKINGGTAFTCNTVTTLAPGASTSCTANYPVTQADMDGGSVTNVASGHGKFCGTTINTATDTKTTTATQSPSLGLAKTITAGNPYTRAGHTITYSYTLTNTGNVTLAGNGSANNFSIRDDQIGSPTKNTSFYCGEATSLAPLWTITCTASYTITQADMDSGSVTNKAKGYGKFGGNLQTTLEATKTATAAQEPALTLEKTISAGDPYVKAGNKITYSYKLTNSGNVTLVGNGAGGLFTITDDHIALNAAFTCGTKVTLAPDEYVTCLNDYTLIQADMNKGSVVNLASGHGLWDNDPPNLPQTVNSPNASKTATANQKAELTLIKSVNSGEPFAKTGDELDYKYVLSNTGNVTLVGNGTNGLFTITDDHIASGVAFDCGTTITSLNPNDSVTCTSVKYGITQDDMDAGSVTNKARGHGLWETTPTPTSVASAEASATAAGTQTPVLLLEKSIDETITSLPYDAVDGFIYYKYLLTNKGNVTLFGTGGSGEFTVSDDKASVICPTDTPHLLMHPNETVPCTATHTLTQTDLDADSLTNTAAAHAKDPKNQPVTSANSSATAYADHKPELTLDKTIVEGGDYIAVHGSVNYSYLLTNTGNVTLLGTGTDGVFTVTDNKTSVTCPSTPKSLAHGKTITCTGSYTLTQADLDAKFVTNIAQAHAKWGVLSKLIDSNTDTETAEGTWIPSFTLVKSIDLTKTTLPFTAVNDKIYYKYELTNSGNVTLHGDGTGGIFTVSDNKATVVCPADPKSLSSGDKITCTATYTVKQADLDEGKVINFATAHSLWGDSPTPSKEDTQEAAGKQQSGLTLVKSITSGDPYIKAGDSIKYSYVLTNSGNVTLHGNGSGGVFTVSDQVIISGLADNIISVTCPEQVENIDKTSLASGESVACTATYLVTIDDIKNETITNKAIAHALWVDVPVNSDEKTVTANVKRGSITGVVYNDANLDLLKDLKETGIKGVNVKLYDSTGAILLAEATTAADGSYSFSDLLPRTYRVFETDLDDYASTTDNTVSVTVPPNENRTADFGDYKIPGRSNNQISGIVFDDANANGVIDNGEVVLEGVTITLVDGNNQVVATTTTDNKGAYLFTLIPPGVYTVLETNPGDPNPYWSTTLDEVSVVLEAGTKIVVNYGDETGDSNSILTLIDPAVTKHGTPSAAKVGETVIYTIDVGNNGNLDAEGVVLTDTKPDFLDIIHINVAPDNGFAAIIDNSKFTIDFGTVKKTDHYIVTVVTRVNKLGKKLKSGTNDVTITTTSKDNPTFNDSASVTLKVKVASSSNSSGGGGGDSVTLGNLPLTGFAPGVVTLFPFMPESKAQADSNLVVEIPALGIKTTIVGLPQTDDGSWDLTWLGKQLGYLEGTAFPTWAGNSVITGHVYGSDGLPGPLVNLGNLKWGDQVIVHAFGQRYVYEVRSVYTTNPEDMTAFEHQDLPWVTLVTCKQYDAATNTYKLRLIVKSVLVQIISDPPPVNVLK